ncbi:MAG: hypothetical protein KJ666_02110 [Bacteroidetes bacterium]|nr:hypothetical protein [Bacteroidota bacterium]
MSQYKSFSESHIAAKIILGEREKNNNNEKHRATLAVSRKANRIAIIAIIIASISLIVILFDI